MENRKINYRAFVLTCVIVLSASSLVRAKDIYVAQNAAGSNNGLDAANAYSLSWLNNSANWGAGVGQVSAGDTVHLCGTFTNALVVAGNGSAGNPVTIFFEAGANFTSPCWSGFGAIQLNGVSYITIDGGSSGKIQNINNGLGLGLTNNSRGIGGHISGVGECYFTVIKNLTVTNIFRKFKGGDRNGLFRLGYGIDLTGSSITVSNCMLSDGDGPLGYNATGNQSNVFLLNNRIFDGNHLITIGIGNVNSYLTNLIIAGNYLDHWDTWDTYPNDTQIHLDGIIILNNSYNVSSVISGFRIFGNTFGGYIGRRTTAGIFTDVANPVAQMQNLFIYNNLFLAYEGNHWGNGFITAQGSNVIVANNTCIGSVTNGANWGGGLGVGGTNALLYNNILTSGAGLTLVGYTSNSISGSSAVSNKMFIISNWCTSVRSDYNLVIKGVGTQGFQLACAQQQTGNYGWISGIMGTLHDWQTWYDNNLGFAREFYTNYWLSIYDPHSKTNIPMFISGTYIPATNDIAARVAGTNLTAVFARFGIPTTDFNGNPRPATGPWTIGAFEAIDPNTPFVSLVASPISIGNGQSIQLTWTSVNATNLIISGLGEVPLNGSTNLSQDRLIAFYTAMATGSNGTSSASVRVPHSPSGVRVRQ